MTQEEAIELMNSKFWESMNSRDIAMFQMFEERICMPWEVFHKAISEALNRPVYTHEFGLNRSGLEKELLGEKSPPSFDEIMNLIPAEKRILIHVMPKVTGCDHDWDNDGCNPENCLKCGMSFMQYVHTECP